MQNADNRTNITLSQSVNDAEQQFITNHPASRAQAEIATKTMPGGNTRSVLHYSPFPLTIASAEGAMLTDIDGHQYADFLGEYTAGLYGHSHPLLQKTITDTISSGLVLGGSNRFEAEYSALLCDRFPSLDLLRFCNSGTEANLFAISAARMFTKREKVMVFHGGYHGGVFYFGMHKPPINAPFPYVLSTYNDVSQTSALIDQHAGELAAIVVEPMLGSAGAIPAEVAFLQNLRDKANEHGIVLIFDEVMTSRLSSGGLQEKLGVCPDMTTLGKYLGGGMSFGAFGGREDIMRRFNPFEPDAVPHAGTFNNNVVSMAAGLTGLRDIYTIDAQTRLNGHGEQLKQRLNALFAKHDVPMQITGIGSIMGIHFQRGIIGNAQDTWPKDEEAQARLSNLQKLLHLDLLDHGYYIARRGFMSLSMPLEQSHYDGLVHAFDEFLSLRLNLLQS